MKITFIFALCYLISCTAGISQNQITNHDTSIDQLKSELANIWQSEQEPLRIRDSLGRVHGYESEEFNKQDEICDRNHAINEQRIKEILDSQGWPDQVDIGEEGSLTICNVLQHSSPEVRVEYLPMMRQAVKDNKLHPRLLARAEDRIATDKGEMQIYGGQMKYYPETKTFNVWPVYDPVNIDKRRAEIGLGPIAEHLKNRFDFDWNLEEQIQRTNQFIRNKKNEKK